MFWTVDEQTVYQLNQSRNFNPAISLKVGVSNRVHGQSLVESLKNLWLPNNFQTFDESPFSFLIWKTESINCITRCFSVIETVYKNYLNKEVYIVAESINIVEPGWKKLKINSEYLICSKFMKSFIWLRDVLAKISVKLQIKSLIYILMSL